MKRIVSICTALMVLLSLTIVSLPAISAAQDGRVEPAAGPAGTTFSFGVSGFDRGERLGVWLNAPNGTILAIGGNNAYARGGEFSYSWTSRAGVALGTWQLVVVGTDSDVQRVVAFQVTEAAGNPPVGAVGVNPQSGTAGDTLTFYAAGFSHGERIGYWLNAPTGGIVPLDDMKHYANGRGEFSTTWQVPGGAAPGAWQLVAQGTSSGVQQVIAFEVR